MRDLIKRTGGAFSPTQHFFGAVSPTQHFLGCLLLYKTQIDYPRVCERFYFRDMLEKEKLLKFMSDLQSWTQT